MNAKRTILIVDDDENLLRLGNILLRRAGYHVVTAVGGCEALEKLQDGPVSLVVMDLNMPGLDGLSTAQALAAGEWTRKIPVIVASGLPFESTRLDRDLPNLAAYLEKPLDYGVLVSEIRLALEEWSKA